MANWQTKKLGEWGVQVLDGDRGKNYPNQTELHSQGDCLFLSATNVTKNGFKFDEQVFISAEKDQKLGKGKLVSDDIVVTTRGTVGNLAHYSNTVSFSHIRINSGMAIIRNSLKTGLNTRYLLKYLLSPVHKREVDRVTFGSAQPQLTIASINKFPVSAPEKPEQERIVGVLEVWDEYIDKLEQKIALKEQLKKGLMQQLLTGKRRLPGFQGEWQNVKLSELGSVIRGVSYNPKEDLLEDDTDSSARLLRSNNVQKGEIILNDIQIVSRNKVRNNQLLQKNDIVVCMANGSKRLVGKSALFNKNDGFLYTIGAFMGVYRGGESTVSRLVKYLLATSRYEYYIASTLSGSSINNLKGSDIENMEFRVPIESKEVLAISDALDVAQSEVDMLRLKQSKIIEQKKYLLKNLITGTIRTPETLRPKGANS